ncbi:hypothetical protein DFQ28_007501 [Apophysomyces sp. BC1034]|nr:hypothetical protein DFQ30_000350 [Apophysomyces sp. BC1015]KAG0176134.1 hypothetical protein DFQ29_006519 [Apophysomyces sp. BC1021]KAG0186652.1 hypothetical protein DFQ28_007501 [Apophysomyces sp. BC1034]
MSDDDDNVWASSDEETTYDRDIAEREWNRLHQNHGNEGYKEGIIEGKEVKMQGGFDRGYEEGLKIGKAMGKLRGIVSSYLIFYRQIIKDEEIAQRLQTLHDEIQQVDVHHIYSKDYFLDNAEEREAGYVSPEQFVQRWQEKVDVAIQSVVKQ